MPSAKALCVYVVVAAGRLLLLMVVYAPPLRERSSLKDEVDVGVFQDIVMVLPVGEGLVAVMLGDAGGRCWVVYRYPGISNPVFVTLPSDVNRILMVSPGTNTESKLPKVPW